MSTDVFRAVADPTRRALLDLLLDSDRSVRELTQCFRVSQSAISQHLRVLREAKLVEPRREGRLSLYRLNPKPVEAVYDWAVRYRDVRDPSGHVWRLRGKSSPKRVGRGGR